MVNIIDKDIDYMMTNIASMYNYPSGLIFGFDFALQDETKAPKEVTEDADFEIVEPKQLPNATTDNS